MVQPDNFSLFQPLVLALALDGRARPEGFAAARSPWPGCSPGSPRSRGTTACWSSRRSASRSPGTAGVPGGRSRGGRAARRSDRHAHTAGHPARSRVACVALFVLVMAPWWLRQLAVFGSISPSTASGKVFFIREIGEWNSITTPATLDHLLGMGIGPLLLATRIGGLIAALMIFTTLIAGFVLAPFMVDRWLGATPVARLRRRSSLYAALLFAFSTIVSAPSTCPAARSSIRRSRSRRTPYILALEGIALAVGWVAARRRAWDAAAATRVFTGATLAFAAVAAFFGIAVRARRSGPTAATSSSPSPTRSTSRAPPRTDRVMSIDASGTKYWTGRGGVVLVNDPHRDDRGGRPRLRHPLARPRSRGQRRSAGADPRRHARPAWLGDPDPAPRASQPPRASCP